MNLTETMRAALLSAALTAAPVAGAVAQTTAQTAAGPIQLGPSWGQADAANHAARLSMVITNDGPVADRLIRVACPASGQVALLDGTLHQDIETPTASQQHLAEQQRQAGGPPQNGLDIPPALHGQPQRLTALFQLAHATQPLTDGTLVPCTVTFAHGGERIVMFALGETPHPTAEP